MKGLAVELATVESCIDNAVRKRGHVSWRWASTKANPNVVPLVMNDIYVFTDIDGSNFVTAAIEYLRESE